MKNLNKVNGADIILLQYAKQVLDEFPDPIYGCEMGVAYGGGVEAIGELWRDRKGIIYGFDTFEDLHPKHLAEDQTAFEATCMDYWYGLEGYGTRTLSYEYQLNELKGLNLDNVILVKGEVHAESTKDIPHLNYAFLDMDLPVSMANGYTAVKDKIVKNGYLFLHDTHNIPSLRTWYREIVIGRDKDMWEVVVDAPISMLVGLKRTAKPATVI